MVALELNHGFNNVILESSTPLYSVMLLSVFLGLPVTQSVEHPMWSICWTWYRKTVCIKCKMQGQGFIPLSNSAVYDFSYAHIRTRWGQRKLLSLVSIAICFTELAKALKFCHLKSDFDILMTISSWVQFMCCDPTSDIEILMMIRSWVLFMSLTM